MRMSMNLVGGGGLKTEFKEGTTKRTQAGENRNGENLSGNISIGKRMIMSPCGMGHTIRRGTAGVLY